jgi:hypothetical protein
MCDSTVVSKILLSGVFLASIAVIISIVVFSFLKGDSLLNVLESNVPMGTFITQLIVWIVVLLFIKKEDVKNFSMSSATIYKIVNT